jgi:two-component system, sensor histidine kinase RegB
VTVSPTPVVVGTAGSERQDRTLSGAGSLNLSTRRPSSRGALRSGGMRLRTLVVIRWLALAGQTATVLGVHLWLGFDLALAPLMVAILVSGWLNVWLSLRYPATHRIGPGAATLNFSFDLLQLATVLALTGGLENPFAVLMVAPVIISATALGVRPTAILAGLAALLLSALAFLHLPLPWSGPSPVLPAPYVAGIWTALVVTMIFIAAYAWRIAGDARRMSAALNATQLALSREQRLSALGGLAAAAAHELGTPLGTIAVIARELERDLAGDDTLAKDIAVLRTQAERCREILAGLTRPGAEREDSLLGRQPVTLLVETIAEPYASLRPDVEIAASGNGDGPEPRLVRLPEIVHGLGNFVANAIHFAESRVDLAAHWTETDLTLVIRDDGPGFAPEIFGALGEPYVSSRREAGDETSMGLGIFIAKTLLEHTGARVAFANTGTGAEVRLDWMRQTVENDFHDHGNP